MGVRNLRGAGRLKLQGYLAARRRKREVGKHIRKVEEGYGGEEEELEIKVPKIEASAVAGYKKGAMCPFAISHMGQLKHLECIAHHCMLWDGKHTTCSLRTIPTLLSEISKK